ncbi:CDP-diacylglycerol--glycerol-3-phosphate 3-phosphatidyltransferase [Rickettsiales bacterium]|nr:CDP-diacylglycerol--glycerol-3-phosphate 3-phosphatidyltransferase [Rickettsiales bacterium]
MSERRDFISKIPNTLTFTRIALSPVIMLMCLYLPQEYMIVRSISGTLFIVLCLTDLLDGYIARKYKTISEFGIVSDNISDKILVNVALISLLKLDKVSPIVVTLMICRDITISGLREYAAKKQESISVSTWGKIKTFIQMTAISILIISKKDVSGSFNNNIYIIGTMLIWATAVLSVITLYNYIKRFIEKS